MLEKRGRKSTADLESADIVSLELPGSRPEPPLDLSPEEAAVWRNAVGCMPARWFGRERQLVLRGYVAHVVAADHAWKMYEAALHDPRTPAKELGRLQVMFHRETDGVRHSSRHLGLLKVGRAYRKVPKYAPTPVMPWEG